MGQSRQQHQWLLIMALLTSTRPFSTQQLPQLQGCKINSLLGHFLRQGERGNIVCKYPRMSCHWQDAAKLSGKGAAPAQVLAEGGGSQVWRQSVGAGFASQEHILQGDILRCGLQPLQMGENSLSSQDAEALPQKRAEPHQMGGKQPPAASLSS